MNAKSLIALAALAASTGAFAQQHLSQAERDFYGFDATVTVGKSRADVQAELQQARASGELERIRADYYGNEAAPMVSGKTRDQVKAELAQARETGELERIRADYYGFEQPAARAAGWVAQGRN